MFLAIVAPIQTINHSQSCSSLPHFLLTLQALPLSIMCSVCEKQLIIVRTRLWHTRASQGLLIHCTQSERHEDNSTHSVAFSFIFLSFSLRLFLSLNLFRPLTLWAGATVISHYLTIKSQELIKWPQTGVQSTFPLSPAP